MLLVWLGMQAPSRSSTEVRGEENSSGAKSEPAGRGQSMKRFSTGAIIFLWILTMLILRLTSPFAHAAELRIAPVTTQSGQPVDILIKVQGVDNLAGVKLVMTFDPDILTFKRGAKTKATESLMHVINDKKPGLLIIVMAGARGISGKDTEIFKLTFDTKGGLKENHTTKFEIKEAQLMSDQLKEIKCGVQVSPVTILP